MRSNRPKRAAICACAASAGSAKKSERGSAHPRPGSPSTWPVVTMTSAASVRGAGSWLRQPRPAGDRPIPVGGQRGVGPTGVYHDDVPRPPALLQETHGRAVVVGPIERIEPERVERHRTRHQPETESHCKRRLAAPEPPGQPGRGHDVERGAVGEQVPHVVERRDKRHEQDQRDGGKGGEGENERISEWANGEWASGEWRTPGISLIR